MRNRKRFILPALLFVLAAMTGCKANVTDPDVVSQAASVASRNSTEGLRAGSSSINSGVSGSDGRNANHPEEGYISLAATTYDDPKNTNGPMSIHVFCYDLSAGKATEVCKIPYLSQYPLAVYDKRDDYVYYSSKSAVKGEKGDQLFSHDLRTGETVQLTHDVFAINDIIPGKDSVYLSAAKIKTNNVVPVVVNKSSKAVKYISIRGDMDIKKLAFDPYGNQVYVACQSMNAEYIALDKYNNDHHENTKKYIPADTGVYSLDLNQSVLRPVLTLKQNTVYRMAGRNNQLYYVSGTDEVMEDAASEKIYHYDIHSNKVTAVDGLGEKGNMGDTLYYSKDGSKIYYLREGPRELVEHDLKSKKTSVLFSFEQGYINNFVLFP